jgi:hypothetical protein
LVLGKFADTLEAHGSLAKKTAQKNIGACCAPRHQLAHALLKGVANEFKN